MPDLDPKIVLLFFLARLRTQSKLEMRGRGTLSAFSFQRSAKTSSRNAKKSRTRIYPLRRAGLVWRRSSSNASKDRR